jgi:hypothetical protein
MAIEKTTDEVRTPPNPTGKGGFGDHPENRSPGGWRKEESISNQYNRLMRMSPTELGKFEPETVAQMIALTRLRQATRVDGLPDAKEITDRTEGKAPQQFDMTSNGESINNPVVRIIDERVSPSE